jgi:two-component system, NarL family, nitrate/nitrite response regulator NarL
MKQTATSGPSAVRGKITVCIAISDRALARRMASLLAGDGHLDIHLGLSQDTDVILADHAQSLPRPQIIINGDGEQYADPWEGNVRAILPPTVDRELLRAAVMMVATGFIISEADRPHGFSDDALGPASSLDMDNGELTLTPRESEVLSLLAHGASNKVIARTLQISVHTAKFHVASVLAKLGARNRSDAVAIGIRRGLILL